MICQVTTRQTDTFPVYAKFLDAPAEDPFGGTRFEQDPAGLDLSAVEREDIGKGRAAIDRGYHIRPEGVPRRLLWPGGTKMLPEIIFHQSKAVSARFRDLVEEFEPAVH